MLANFFTFLHSTTNFDKHFLAYMIFLVLSSYKRKGVQKMRSNKFTAEKCGTITVSVYKNADKFMCFLVESDCENVANVAEVIEDTLYNY